MIFSSLLFLYRLFNFRDDVCHVIVAPQKVQFNMAKLFHIPLFAFFSFLAFANGCVIKCPETSNGDMTFIPSPFDCSKFYVCANSDPVEMTCPDGLWFNTELSKCDYPENVKCNNGN